MRRIEVLKERAEDMRKKPTYHEAKFKERLELAGLLLTCQKVIGNYIVDFCIGKIIVEIDGASHYETYQHQYDKERTSYLESLGYTVIRIRNENVAYFDLSRLTQRKKQKSDKCPKRLRQPRLNAEEKNRLKPLTNKPTGKADPQKIPDNKDLHHISSLFKEKKPWEYQ